MVSWFAILVLICVLLFTIFLLFSYPSKHTPIIVYTLVFIGWFTSFAIVALLPYDIYLAKSGSGDKDLLYTAWRVIYWTAFCLCWLVLPMTEQFHTSGEFTFLSKLKNACTRRLRSFIIIITVGIAFILYMYFVQKLTLNRIPELLVLLSNIWGLFLVITLLGFGLVALPMRYWREGSLEKTLETLQLQSVTLDESNIDVKYRLDQCVMKVIKILKKVPEGSPLRKFIEIIVKKCPETSLEHLQALKEGQNNDVIGKIDYTRLVNLHKELKDLISENTRSEW